MNELSSNQPRINPSFIINALRNCGYTNYSALADIIDNSLENNVNSKNIKISFETEGKGSEKEITSILIIDDGCGMSKDVLDEATALGSESGKNGENNLGMYGVGLKTASLSIGQRLEVYTRAENDNVYISIMDIENGNIHTGLFDADEAEISFFETNIKSNTGTIVKITKLDRLTNKSLYNFKNTLKRKLGEIFNKYIDANYCNIFVDTDKVEMVDLIGNKVGIPSELLSEKNSTFIVDGKEIRYNVWFIPTMGDDMIKGDNYLARNTTTSGLYIYRHNRLVGSGLNLGVMSEKSDYKDSWLNGLRIEIYVDGTFDNLFGSTYTKMISERDRDSMNQSLRDKMRNELGVFTTVVLNREKSRVAANKDKKQDMVFYNKVQKKQDDLGTLLGVKQKGVNSGSDQLKKPNSTTPKRQKNPNPIKIRKDSWCTFEERSMGMTDTMYTSEMKNGKALILINIDHTFYKNFYCELSNEHKFVLAQLFSCDYVAKQNCNYYNDEDTRKIIDNYNLITSEAMRKSLDF